MKLIYACLILIWLFIEPSCGDLLKDVIEKNCDDVIKSCVKRGTVPLELTVLECAVKKIKAADIRKECRRSIFDFIRDYFKGKNGLNRTLATLCSDEMKTRLKCDSEKQKYIFCILSQKDKLTDEYYCEHLIQRLEMLASSNYAFISDFPVICESDIREGCNSGSTDDKSVAALGDNSVLDCLQKRIDYIKDVECRKEILSISELQGENFKLDNSLLQACKSDQMKFCSDLEKSDGSLDPDLVYKCLQEFVNTPTFSLKCRDELFKKEKLVVKDPNVSKGLIRSCRDDIHTYHCRKMISDNKNVRLVQILLCLENAVHNGSRIASDCRSEMTRHRRLLMNDYRLSPEVVSKCFEDIELFCRGFLKGGKTIHCLLDHSRPRRRSQKVVSPTCQRSLENLLKVTDAGEDWRVDPVLRRSCAEVVRLLCSNVRGDGTKVMSCLMDNINSNLMEEACGKALMEIQYFISRDFKLDPQLFSACQEDAVKLCHAKHSWSDDPSRMDPERGPLVLPCLYRYVYNHDSDQPEQNIKLKSNCEEQVRRVMRQRAINVELIPEVEEACLDELVLYCSDKTKPGEEMLCLQDKYTLLKPKCRSVVGNFTEAEAADINLNPIVKSYCKEVIDAHCKDELRGTKGDESASNDIMSCLIKHKNDADVRIYYKCRAAIEHFQLITLNDYHFTIAFKDACRPYVIHYCPKAHTKAQVVECLSEVTQNDTLKDVRYKLSKECRYQLRAQLLQQREFIDLDPKLKLACEKDIQTFCPKTARDRDNKPDVPVLECLEDNINSLSPPCHKMVFRIEQHDFKDSSSDYTLLTTCKIMIKEYCKGINTSSALTCLKQFKDEPVFDNNCRSLVLKRMVEQSADYRLNPALQRGCSQDIGKFCLALMKNHVPDVEFEGKILNCLKIKFRERKLRKECEKQLSVLLKEAALNYKLNPLLRNLCTNEIQTLCSAEVQTEERDSAGRVEECLKVALVDGRIMNRACKLEVAGLIEEAKADIHVDPLLHNACVADIHKYCIDVAQGAGRILQCLQMVLSSKNQHLQPDCKFKLTQRIEMFKNAEPLIKSEPKNFEELIGHVTRSPSKKFFVVIMFTIVGVIFMLGLFCGRITRRTAMLKNK